ncbi:hypothetical protein [Brumimicrobium aurantiacum]|uniref:DUF4292 domain-containing protein n=1 Tax=Brumimicrobium aurantiacum TaxID=1737063 RepID=A0A3E1EUV9_9FLAO|nr:hypothetical protein [Brumimicrobium aurantiacum]RFC53335.1 hypothetical protein DXU93_12945 [Brumimicrobium aurantiacum]
MKLIFIFLTLFLFACSTQKHQPSNFEGKLIYSISSKMNNPNENDSINHQIVYAKDSMLRIDSYTPIGKQIYIKHIPKNKAYILMDLGTEKVAIQTIQDTTSNSDRYLFEKKIGKDKFAGRKAKRIEVTDTAYDTTIIMNYLPEIPAKYSTAIEGMPGLPVNYSLYSNGLWLKYSLNTIEEKELNIDLFGIPSDHRIITLDEFIEIIQN